jgi:hypothetical protein
VQDPNGLAVLHHVLIDVLQRLVLELEPFLDQLGELVLFSMEIIILIWKSRNEWLFSNKDPSVLRCTQEFSREMRLIIHRARGKFNTSIPNWLSLWQT